MIVIDHECLLHFSHQTKRSTLSLVQCKDAISFPMNLDFTEYVHPVDGKAQAADGKKDSESEERLEYTLTGIILHRGTSASAGHYVAIVKDERTGDWWKYDDDSVTNMGTHPFKGAKWDPVSGDDPNGNATTGAKKGGNASGKGGAAGGRGRGGKKGPGSKKAGRGRGGGGRSKAAKNAPAPEVQDIIEIDADQPDDDAGVPKGGVLKRQSSNLPGDELGDVQLATKVAKTEVDPAAAENDRLALLLAGGDPGQDVADVKMKSGDGMADPFPLAIPGSTFSAKMSISS